MTEDSVTKEMFFSSRYAQMVGFIFAVIIARSFENYSDILFTPWSDWLAFFALVGLYAFVILSWAGYQQSLQEYPYTKTKLSTLRVMSDFLIVVIYVFMLNSIQQIQASDLAVNYELGFVFTFIAYIIGGKLRQMEYSKEASKQLKLYYTLLALVIIFASYFSIINYTSFRHPLLEWGGVIAPMVVTVIWRYWRDIGGVINKS